MPVSSDRLAEHERKEAIAVPSDRLAEHERKEVIHSPQITCQ